MARLADRTEPLLTAARVLSRNQADSGREITARPVDAWIGNGGHERAGDHRPDARHLHQPAPKLGPSGIGGDASIVFQDLLLYDAENSAR
jgi:hypothetical protein